VRGTGYLRLYSMNPPTGYNNLWDLPDMLMQKLPAMDFTATTKVRIGIGKAGLVILGQSYACITLETASEGNKIAQSTCSGADQKGVEIENEAMTLRQKTIYLRVKVNGPDAMCTFSYSIDGNDFKNIGKEFKAVAGGWIGAKVGIFCLGGGKSGYADFDWFRIE
jgi:beta-xylosidase